MLNKSLKTLKNSVIALSLAGLSMSPQVQAHGRYDSLLPLSYFFYNLEYAPHHQHSHRHDRHLIKKHKKAYHKRHHRDPRVHHSSHRKHRQSYSHDHYSKQKPRHHVENHHSKKHHGGKRLIKKYDRY